MSMMERLLAKTIPEPNSGCWLFVGAWNAGGYGNSYRNGKYIGAHVASWEEANGPVPAGLELDHKCRVRCCINPAHLEPVTRQENLRRGDIDFGRFMRAKETCPNKHPYDGVNTRGARTCSTCRRDRDREHKRHKRAKQRTRA